MNPVGKPIVSQEVCEMVVDEMKKTPLSHRFDLAVVNQDTVSMALRSVKPGDLSSPDLLRCYNKYAEIFGLERTVVNLDGKSLEDVAKLYKEGKLSSTEVYSFVKDHFKGSDVVITSAGPGEEEDRTVFFDFPSFETLLPLTSIYKIVAFHGDEFTDDHIREALEKLPKDTKIALYTCPKVTPDIYDGNEDRIILPRRSELPPT